ncbi:MAG: Wzz/FepE/Etk N-terminal domain-containing protein [Eubacteriales bacterium]|nr:Wzz/FepE/Etk N-terminal domain-containing protein [Eubacteriales bacterium]
MDNKREMANDYIDLVALCSEYIKRWWLFLICGIAGGAILFAVTVYLITPQYQSSSMLYVLSKTTSITSVTDLSLADELTEDYSIIAKSKPVLDGAIEQVKQETGTEMTRGQANAMISVANQASRILVITATCDDPELAAALSNAVAEKTMEQMADITKTDPPSMVEKAEVSSSPSSPNVMGNTLKGILGGIILAGLFLTVCFLMNDNIKTEDDIEKYLGLSTLALIPENSKKTSRKKTKAHKKKKA